MICATKASGPPEHRLLLPIDWNSEELPTMPSIAHRLIEMLCRREMETEEIYELISQDPALTLKVLQICNSALYGFSSEVTSIKHAVVLLGQKEVVQLAVSSLLAKRFMTVPSELKGHAETLWHHLIATATLAQEFAVDSEEPDLYTLGMLHDVGWLVLMSQAPRVFLSMAEERGRSLDELQAAWGVDHELWGGKLLEKWNLPEPFQVVAFRHHHPVTDAAPPKYLLVTALANHLANSMGNCFLQVDLAGIPGDLLSALGLDEKAYQEMLEWAQQEREKIAARSRTFSM